MNTLHKAIGCLLMLAASGTACSLGFDFLLPGSLTLTPQAGTAQVEFDLAALDPRYAGRWSGARAEKAELQFDVLSFAIPDPVFPTLGPSLEPVRTVTSKGFDLNGVYRIEKNET